MFIFTIASLVMWSLYYLATLTSSIWSMSKMIPPSPLLLLIMYFSSILTFLFSFFSSFFLSFPFYSLSCSFFPYTRNSFWHSSHFLPSLISFDYIYSIWSCFSFSPHRLLFCLTIKMDN